MLLILLPLLLLIAPTVDCDGGNASEIVLKWKMIDKGCGVVKACWVDASCFGSSTPGSFHLVDRVTYNAVKNCPMGLTVRRLNATKRRVNFWVPGDDINDIRLNGGLQQNNIICKYIKSMQTLNNVTYCKGGTTGPDFFNSTMNITTLKAGKFGQTSGSIQAEVQLDSLPQGCPIEEPIIVDACSDGFDCRGKGQIERVELPEMRIECNSTEHKTQILYNGNWTFVNLTCASAKPDKPVKPDEPVNWMATDVNGSEVIGDVPLTVRCAYEVLTPPPTPPPHVTDSIGDPEDESWKDYVLTAGYVTVLLLILVIIAIIIWCCFAKIRACCGCAKEDTVEDPEEPELIDLEPGQTFQVLESSYEVTKVFENRSSKDVHFRAREDEGGFNKHLIIYPQTATVKPNEKLAVRISYSRNAPPKKSITFVYEYAFSKFKKDGSRKGKRSAIPCDIPDVLTQHALLHGADDYDKGESGRAPVVSNVDTPTAPVKATPTDSDANQEPETDILGKIAEEELLHESDQHSTDQSASRESNIHHDLTPLIGTKGSKKNSSKRKEKKEKNGSDSSAKSGKALVSRKSVKSGRNAAMSLRFFKTARSVKSNNSITGKSPKSRTRSVKNSHKEHESYEQIQQTQ